MPGDYNSLEKEKKKNPLGPEFTKVISCSADQNCEGNHVGSQGVWQEKPNRNVQSVKTYRSLDRVLSHPNGTMDFHAKKIKPKVSSSSTQPDCCCCCTSLK